jgi:hypothetical protein
VCKTDYIPIKAKTAYASASQGTNTPKNGTKAARPVHRKNNHIHQPEIVLGNEVVPVLTGDAFNAMLKPPPDTSVLLPLALTIGISQIIRGVLQLGRNFGAELMAQKWNAISATSCIFRCSARA